ncbi:flagellum site-determining protein YlxH [Clostridium acetireducens DSM 10703]|jgi:flagellar biosynthesis protein FlhG|uniref:Flagellum site-determining protein YlxH n=1 Tax=Clostridium acetireducens DSM 10703 TaxID=1121290 RepID=A0A1E8F0J4_9CLOT|nr:MinD/ParA family protein [Clostridium acetireducens]OFI06823.1 flagellum site-determining protein YlxH [Clostridium acetireducens DSM 10703]
MMDQAQRLRELAIGEDFYKNLNKSPKIITVTSGKGGVGKSNFVVNLAISLQKRGKNVMIFDGDIGMGNDDILMGFLPKYNVFDIILKDLPLEEAIIVAQNGVRLLPGGTGLNRIAELSKEQRIKFINKLVTLEDLDYILMDTSAGVNKNVLGFIDCSDEVIIITTSEPTSLTDAYSLVKLMHHFGIKSSVKLVVNKVLEKKEGREVFNKFSSATWRFLKMDVKYIGSISEDKNIIKAVKRQEPFVISFPDSIASMDIKRIANIILGDKRRNKTSGIQNLFKRLFKMFL